ncbi:MAG: hypothetical protein HYX33_00485 [Actinobacteria bacterium]|nr:hypothetical protein [Actinomycetota bacterium]
MPLLAALSISVAVVPALVRADDFSSILRVTMDQPPALAGTSAAWTVIANTNNGLMAYRRQSGRAGTGVVPDIAAAPPRVSGGGRTYLFRVRRGVFFSPIRGGDPMREVVASDVKASLERLFAMNPEAARAFENIVGASELLSRRTRGPLTGVTASDAAGTVTIRLREPDPSILEALALPVASVLPRGTPPYDQSTTPPVATGPYVVRRYERDRSITLQRNPNFKSYTRALPEGFVSGIEVEIGVKASDSLSRIAAGDADATLSRLAPDKLAPYRGSNRARDVFFVTSLDPATYYFFMNTGVRPFSDLRVRRAVNLAIDRRKLSDDYLRGQSRPTAQVLPTVIPGYAKIPSPRTDIRLARRLVREARAENTPVKVYGFNNQPSLTITPYLVTVLRSIGLRATPEFLDEQTFADRVGRNRKGAQIGYSRWIPIVPDCANFFDPLDGRKIGTARNPNLSFLNDASVNSAIASARRLALGAPRDRACAALDRMVVERKPWAPFANSTRTDMVSTRVIPATYVAHPLFGFLWAEARLR